MRPIAPSEHIAVSPRHMGRHLRGLLADGGIRRVVVSTRRTPLQVDADVPMGVTAWPFLLVPIAGLMRVWCARGGTTETVELQPRDAVLYGPDTWAAVDVSRVKALFRVTMSSTDTLVGFRAARGTSAPPALDRRGLQLCALEEALPRRSADLVSDALSVGGEWANERRVHAINLVLYDLHEMFGRGSLGRQGKAHATWVAVRTYVEEHAECSIGRTDVARAVGVDARHVSRLFRRFAAMSFQAYVERMREERARRLLTTTAMPIKEIAAMCGYRETSYFGRVFKRRTGVTPGAYRSGHA